VAQEEGYPVADIWSLLVGIKQEGFIAGGMEFTADFISGGMFSLDGVHPTDTAQALVADTFIGAINGGYGSSIPSINFTAVLGTGTSSGGSQKALWLNPSVAAAIRAMIRSPFWIG
jgi:hypothetical protein